MTFYSYIYSFENVGTRHTTCNLELVIQIKWLNVIKDLTYIHNEMIQILIHRVVSEPIIMGSLYENVMPREGLVGCNNVVLKLDTELLKYHKRFNLLL